MNRAYAVVDVSGHNVWGRKVARSLYRQVKTKHMVACHLVFPRGLVTKVREQSEIPEKMSLQLIRFAREARHGKHGASWHILDVQTAVNQHHRTSRKPR